MILWWNINWAILQMEKYRPGEMSWASHHRPKGKARPENEEEEGVMGHTAWVEKPLSFPRAGKNQREKMGLWERALKHHSKINKVRQKVSPKPHSFPNYFYAGLPVLGEPASRWGPFTHTRFVHHSCMWLTDWKQILCICVQEQILCTLYMTQSKLQAKETHSLYTQFFSFISFKCYFKCPKRWKVTNRNKDPPHPKKVTKVMEVNHLLRLFLCTKPIQ